jgi:hypothetical protein
MKVVVCVCVCVCERLCIRAPHIRALSESLQ